MADTKVKISHILDSQIPDFLKEDNPLFKDFLNQYYISQEHEYGITNLVDDFTDHKNVLKFSDLNIVAFQTLYPTKLTSELLAYDDVINVTSTLGFPNTYGLIKINNEIITYTGRTATSFTGCIRGFSGITALQNSGDPELLTFTSTEADEHANETPIANLSHVFLVKFYEKFKAHYLPGIEKRNFHPTLSVENILSRAKDFYISKGTSTSLEVLFKVLYGKSVEVLKPFDNTITASGAEWVISDQIVVEAIDGNPLNLKETTVFQDSITSPTARGAVSNVEEVFIGTKKYHRISLSPDSIFSTFKVNNKTQVIGTASTTAVVTVDSTVGFDTSGTFLYLNSINEYEESTYTSKSHNQFFGCGLSTSLTETTPIIDDIFVYGWEDNDPTKVCKMRAVGCISGTTASPDNTKFFKNDDEINLKHLGEKVPYSNKKLSNWFHNNVSYVDVKIISGSSIETKDTHFLKKYDRIDIIRKDNNQTEHSNVEVNNVIDDTNFTITSGLTFTGEDYSIKKRLHFVSSNLGVGYLVADIQNSFIDSQDNAYVAFSGYPSDSAINTTDRSVTFATNDVTGNTINIIGHEFLNGEKIHYQPLSDDSKISGIGTGTYFVSVVDVNNIKLSLNAQSLYNGQTIAFSGVSTATDMHQITPSIPAGGVQQQLGNQNNFRRILNKPKNNENNTDIVGPIGVTLNGVELHSPISNDAIYYGQINNIIVLNAGENYSVNSPPNVAIADSFGSGAIANAHLSDGKIDEIVLKTRGFDYVGTPSVTLTGGNGTGAELAAKMQGYVHSVAFNDFKVDLPTNKITLDDAHKFLSGEEVIYTAGGRPIGIGSTNVGFTTSRLSDGGKYYISPDPSDVKAFRIYSTKETALVGAASSAIDFLAFGNNTHTFTTTRNRSIIATISVINPGQGYSHNTVKVQGTNYPPSDRKDIFKIFTGCNSFDNYVYAKNHNFKNGDKVIYKRLSTSDNHIASGFSDNDTVFLTVVDKDKFKLSTSKVNQERKIFVNLGTAGAFQGSYIFNYPDISISITGPVGVANTILPSYYTATAEPMIEGKIDNIFIENGGVGYGVTNILNFIRKPTVKLVTGEGASLEAVVSPSGKIEGVVILDGGKDYTTAPILNVIGKGSFAKIRANVTNGVITSVDVINKGKGYVGITSAIDPTKITVVPFGSGASMDAEIYKWQFNNVKRYNWLLTGTNKDTYRDTVQIKSEVKSKGNKLCSFYAPKQIRKILGDNLNSTSFAELGVSEPGAAHSPIIGWAYDGNPIYGSVGNAKAVPDATGTGGIKRLESSYELITPTIISDLRPNNFSPGDFIEDYFYNSSGDLDEHNGRFIVNNDFPQGTYAYFTTVDGSGTTPSWEPTFPYTCLRHKNATDSFNYSIFNDQDDSVINSGKYKRNVTHLGLNEDYRSYPFLEDSSKVKVSLLVNGVKNSGISSIPTLVGGDQYKVGDVINFPPDASISASVHQVLGKGVVSVATTEIVRTNFAFGFEGNTVTGFNTQPHDYMDGDLVEITGISSSLYQNVEGFRTIGVTTVTSNLSVAIAATTTTGINTFIKMHDSTISDKFEVEDIIRVDSEDMLITSKDVWNNRYNVIRKYNGVESTHNVDAEVSLKPVSFTFKVPQKQENKNLQKKKVRYFDASVTTLGGVAYNASVGIGTTSNNILVGYAGSSPIINSSAPRTIYLPNHPFNTGDRLKLVSDPNGGTISVSTSFSLANPYDLATISPLYCIKFTSDYIGISTEKVGFTTTPVYFTNTTSGDRHKFETIIDEVTGDAVKTLGTAVLGGQHGLRVGDDFILDVSPNKTQNYKVKYNTNVRRLTVGFTTFTTSAVGVGTTLSEITVTNHGFKTGDAVVYSGSVPSDIVDPLVNNGIYHVIRVSDDVLKLASSEYDAVQAFPYNNIGFTSTGSGLHTLEKIHPKITAYRGNTVAIGISDPSLSSYTINFYTDDKFISRYASSGISTEGSFGDGNASSKVSILVDDDFPSELYYRIEGLGLNYTNTYPNSVYEETSNTPKIEVLESKFNKEHRVTGIGSTTVSFVIAGTAETTSYTYTGFSTAFYYSDSTNISGGIYNVRVLEGGTIDQLPLISSIGSTTGFDAVLAVESTDAGGIIGTKVQEQGFEITNNKTLAPKADAYTILKLKDIFTLTSIGVATGGLNYTNPPKVIAVGNNELSTKSTLIGNSVGKVEIITNDSGFSESLKIIPTVNSNGVGVIGATSAVVSLNQINTLRLKAPVVGFPTGGFPFAVGDEIFVENVKIQANTGDGYNSDDYDYKYFTVTGINTIAGTESVKYAITGIGSTGGIYDPINAFGRVIKRSDLATFTPQFKRIKYIEGEKVSQGSTRGIVAKDGWDEDSQTLKLKNVIGSFANNQQIIGSAGRTKSTVENSYSFDFDLIVDAEVNKAIDWNTDSGKLNLDSQRLHDNDYYQRFSYSIKGGVPYEVWNEPIDSLAHISGYKNFSDYEVANKLPLYRNDEVGHTTARTYVEVETNVDNEVSVWTKSQYDFATEDTDSRLLSKIITFDSSIITDYNESITNKVLMIDDISSQFTGKTSTFTGTHRFVRDELNGAIGVVTTGAGLAATTGTAYNPQSGVLTIITTTNHNLKNGDKITITDNSLTFTCDKDAYSTEHTYPRNTDPASTSNGALSNGKLPITSIGATTFSVDIRGYAAIVGGQVSGMTTFSLYSDGKTAFIQEFNPASGINTSNNQEITINDHEFHTGEWLNYSGVGNTAIGIVTTNVAGIGNTNILPLNVYPIRVDKDIIKVAISTSNAAAGLAVTFVNVTGVGTNHTLAVETGEATNRSMITVDNVIQSPIARKILNVDLKNAVGVGTTVITLNDATSIAGKSLIKIEDEIIKVNLVGIGSTNALNVMRGFMGTVAVAHTVGAAVTVLSGDYRIDGGKIHFSEAPYGPTGIGTLVTSSTFSGRLFYRLKYDNNFIFDDISEQFTGIGQTFDLTSNGQGVTGIAGINTSYGAILINNIFQKPFYGDVGSVSKSDYQIVGAGETIRFTGSFDTAGNVSIGDTTNYPRGGRINEFDVGIGSGFQPPYGAVANVTVSAAGTVSSVGLVTGGTGYATIPRVSIASTERHFTHRFVSSTNNSVNVTGGGQLTPTDADYNSQTGILKLTIPSHGLTTANTVTLDNASLRFKCSRNNYTSEHNYPRTTVTTLTVTNGSYSTTSGTMNLTIANHGMKSGDWIKMANNSITFSCNFGGASGSAANKSYPRASGCTGVNCVGGADPIAGKWVQISNVTTNTFDINVGITTITNTHTFVSATTGGVTHKTDAAFDATLPILTTTSDTITLYVGKGGGNDAVITASVTAGIVTSLTITNAGTGYTSTNAVISIDPPNPYKDLALTGGTGTGAAMDVVVGTGGSVINFDMSNRGKGYSIGDVLTLDQLPYTAGVTTLPFTVTVTSRYQDKFAGWAFGHLLELDDFSNLFNGFRKSFLFTRTTNVKDYYSIVAQSGSGIILANNLFIFINDVLQRPNIDYTFTGGTRINFLEAPRPGSSCKLYFYVGSDADFKQIDVDQSIKPGDSLQLQPWNNISGQDARIVYELIAADTVETETYAGVGIITDKTAQRPVDWRKQTEDVIIDGAKITKDRNYLTAQVYPTTHLIQNISATDTKMYVENTYPIFQQIDDTSGTRNNIKIVSLGSTVVTEEIDNVTYGGDYGLLVGIGTSATGINTTTCGSLILDFKTHPNIRGLSGKARPGITTGDYFVVRDSVIGTGVTSLGISTTTTVAIGTAFIDNIFFANHHVSVGSSICRVFTNVKDVSGIITSTLPSTVERYGNYSWGHINISRTLSSHAFEFFNQNGTAGIETSAHVSRRSQLRSSY